MTWHVSKPHISSSLGHLEIAKLNMIKTANPPTPAMLLKEFSNLVTFFAGDTFFSTQTFRGALQVQRTSDNISLEVQPTIKISPSPGIVDEINPY